MNDRVLLKEPEPATLVGIWLDHFRAHIVELKGNQVRHSLIESHVGRRHRSTGGTKLPGKSYVKSFAASEKNAESARREHLDRYYKNVLKSLPAVDQLVIMGPGVAKTEFQKTVAKNRRLAAGLRGIVTAKAMTDRQLIAQVKRYFH